MSDVKLTEGHRFYCPLVPYRFYRKSALKPASTQKQKWARFYRMQDRFGVVLDLRNRLEHAARRSALAPEIEEVRRGEG